MPCDIKRDPAGNLVSVVCSRAPRSRPKPCATCGRPGGLLCDFPARSPAEAQLVQTCNASICPKCTDRVAPGIDHCPRHGKAEAAK